MMFSFIAKHRGIWPVALICEVLGVSRSGHYAWLMRSPSDRAKRDEMLTKEIGRSFRDSDRTYGARRVWHDWTSPEKLEGCSDKVITLGESDVQDSRRQAATV